MDTGDGMYKEVKDSRMAIADNIMSTSSMELRGSPFRKGATRTPYTNEVQELLECPVCMNLMYPPIYQVYYFFFTC